MNFNRDFLDSVPFKKFKRSLGREDSLEYVHRIWAGCETRKSALIILSEVEDIALMVNAPKEIPGQSILDAFLGSGLLVEVEPLTYESIVWANHNAALIAKWENGKKGGRPRKENPSEGKEEKKKTTPPNESEENQGEPNVWKDTKVRKGNKCKVKGPVIQSQSEENPNDNQFEIQSNPTINPTLPTEAPFVPTDWERPIASG